MTGKTRITDRSTTTTMSAIEKRATISVEEAAELLGVGRTAAYEAAHRGQLPTRRLGRRLFVPVPAFFEWLQTADSGAGEAHEQELGG